MPDATLEAVGFIGSVRCVDGLALSPRYEVVAFDTEDGAEIARVPVDGAGQFTLRCATDPDLRGMAATLSVRTPSGKIAAEQAAMKNLSSSHC